MSIDATVTNIIHTTINYVILYNKRIECSQDDESQEYCIYMFGNKNVKLLLIVKHSQNVVIDRIQYDKTK